MCYFLSTTFGNLISLSLLLLEIVLRVLKLETHLLSQSYSFFSFIQVGTWSFNLFNKWKFNCPSLLHLETHLFSFCYQWKLNLYSLPLCRNYLNSMLLQLITQFKSSLFFPTGGNLISCFSQLQPETQYHSFPIGGNLISFLNYN